MKTYLTVFVLSFFSSLLLVPLVKRAAHRLRAYGSDQGSSVPRLGGVAIYFSFLIPLVGLFFYDNAVSKLFLEDARLLTGLFIGGTLVLVLGAWDDRVNLSAWTKLLLESAIALFVWSSGFRIDQIGLPFGSGLYLGFWSLPITWFWIVGIMNAINLSDGVDGLAAGISFFAVLTLGTVSWAGGQVLSILLCCALGGALLGFFRYNFPPARIYLGDSGSLFLGYILAILSIWSSQKSATFVALLTPLVALGIPVLDMLLTIVRRYFSGISIFQKDREHIHHRLKALGFSHRRVVLILYGFCILLNGLALGLYVTRNSAWILLVLVVGTILALRHLGYLNKRILEDRWKEFEKLRRERFYQHILDQLIKGFNGQSLSEKVWHLTKGFSEGLKFDFARLEILDFQGENQCYEWSASVLSNLQPYACIQFPLVTDSRQIGSVELRKFHSSRQDSSIFSGTELLAKEITQLVERSFETS